MLWLRLLLGAGLATGLMCCALGCATDDRGGSEAIATVGEAEIPRTEFDRRFNLLVRRAKGVPIVSQGHWRRVARTVAAQALIDAEWVEQEAAKQRIVPPRGIRRSDIRVATLRQKLINRRARPRREPAERRIRAYFAKHRRSYVIPERRSAWIIQARSRAAARKAMAALEHDTTWRIVANRFSRLEWPQANHGLVTMTRRDLPTPIGQALFNAAPNTLQGPIHTSLGWSVFEVHAISPRTQLKLSQVRNGIVARLRTSLSEAQTKFTAELKAKYRPRTRCAEGFRLPLCSKPADGGRS